MGGGNFAVRHFEFEFVQTKFAGVFGIFVIYFRDFHKQDDKIGSCQLHRIPEVIMPRGCFQYLTKSK